MNNEGLGVCCPSNCDPVMKGMPPPSVLSKSHRPLLESPGVNGRLKSVKSAAGGRYGAMAILFESESFVDGAVAAVGVDADLTAGIEVEDEEPAELAMLYNY